MELPTQTVPADKEIWTYFKNFMASHPEIFYKGIPAIFFVYLSFPALILIWQWLPWIWAGYEIYHKIPPGTLTDLWLAMKAYGSL